MAKVTITYQPPVTQPPPTKRVMLELSYEEAQHIRAVLGAVCAGKSNAYNELNGVIFRALYHAVAPGDIHYENISLNKQKPAEYRNQTINCPQS
jgi:hypothetical protein